MYYGKGFFAHARQGHLTIHVQHTGMLFFINIVILFQISLIKSHNFHLQEYSYIIIVYIIMCVILCGGNALLQRKKGR